MLNSSLLTAASSVAGDAWILVLGRTYLDWVTLCPEGMDENTRVSFATSVTEALGLIRKERVGPSVILIDADDIGGLEEAMQCHRRISTAAIYGKCVIKSRSAVLPYSDEEVPLMLTSPASPKVH